MSENVNNPNALPYGNPPAQNSDPYYLHQQRPVSQPKKSRMPKVLIPFMLAGVATIGVFAMSPSRGIMRFYLRSFEVPFPVFLSIVGVVSLVLACGWVKKKIVDSIPTDLRLVPVTAESIPGLDFREFERYTAELQALGFVWRLDYTSKTSRPNFPSGLARLMAHNEHKCVVEINQIISAIRTTPVKCAFMSYAIKGSVKTPSVEWMLSTTDREPESVSYASRLPHSFATSMPAAGPAQLLEAHLTRRREIIKETAVNASDDISTPTYFSIVEQGIVNRRELIKKRNLLAFLFEIDRFEFRPKMEWSGKVGLEGQNQDA